MDFDYVEGCGSCESSNAARRLWLCHVTYVQSLQFLSAIILRSQAHRRTCFHAYLIDFYEHKEKLCHTFHHEFSFVFDFSHDVRQKPTSFRIPSPRCFIRARCPAYKIAINVDDVVDSGNLQYEGDEQLNLETPDDEEFYGRHDQSCTGFLGRRNNLDGLTLGNGFDFKWLDWTQSLSQVTHIRSNLSTKNSLLRAKSFEWSWRPDQKNPVSSDKTVETKLSRTSSGLLWQSD